MTDPVAELRAVVAAQAECIRQLGARVAILEANQADIISILSGDAAPNPPENDVRK